MQHSTTCLCSSWLSVGLSPVVPTGTRPFVPFSICQWTCARKASSSKAFSRKGVTRAVSEPESRRCVVIQGRSQGAEHSHCLSCLRETYAVTSRLFERDICGHVPGRKPCLPRLRHAL